MAKKRLFLLLLIFLSFKAHGYSVCEDQFLKMPTSEKEVVIAVGGQKSVDLTIEDTATRDEAPETLPVVAPKTEVIVEESPFNVSDSDVRSAVHRANSAEYANTKDQILLKFLNRHSGHLTASQISKLANNAYWAKTKDQILTSGFSSTHRHFSASDVVSLVKNCYYASCKDNIIVAMASKEGHRLSVSDFISLAKQAYYARPKDTVLKYGSAQAVKRATYREAIRLAENAYYGDTKDEILLAFARAHHNTLEENEIVTIANTSHWKRTKDTILQLFDAQSNLLLKLKGLEEQGLIDSSTVTSLMSKLNLNYKKAVNVAQEIKRGDYTLQEFLSKYRWYIPHILLRRSLMKARLALSELPMLPSPAENTQSDSRYTEAYGKITVDFDSLNRDLDSASSISSYTDDLQEFVQILSGQIGRILLYHNQVQQTDAEINDTIQNLDKFVRRLNRKDKRLERFERHKAGILDSLQTRRTMIIAVIDHWSKIFDLIEILEDYGKQQEARLSAMKSEFQIRSTDKDLLIASEGALKRLNELQKTIDEIKEQVYDRSKLTEDLKTEFDKVSLDISKLDLPTLMEKRRGRALTVEELRQLL